MKNVVLNEAPSGSTSFFSGKHEPKLMVSLFLFQDYVPCEISKDLVVSHSNDQSPMNRLGFQFLF